MAVGICRYCHCTDEKACAEGCAWIDEAQDRCSVCFRAQMRALILLGAFTEIHPEIDALRRAPDEIWAGYSAAHQQFLVMAIRAADEAVPSDVEADHATVTAELGGLMLALEQRFPEAIAKAGAEGHSLQQVVFDLLDGKGRVALVGG